MHRFLISKAIGQHKLWDHQRTAELGRAHYSWAIIARLYEQGLSALNHTTQEIVRPEIYQSRQAAAKLQLSGNDIHLAVKPIEELRRLKYTRNFFVCGWEFPEYSVNSIESNPFFNQIQTLKGSDAVLCWSDYTRKNLEAYGLGHVFTLPPPLDLTTAPEVPLPGVEGLTLDTRCQPGTEPMLDLAAFYAAHPGCKRFVSVLNPWDNRKEFPLMLSEFVQASEETSNICLVVKLVIDNEGTTVRNINEILKVNYGLDLKATNVMFIGDKLPDNDLRQILKQVEFYLCTSSVEGLNLPLIEAMSQGTIPLAPWNSAMGTYLDESCSLRIECQRRPNERRTHALHDHLETTIFPPREGFTRSTIVSAAKMTEREITRMSRNAKLRAREQFGLSTFSDRLEGILN